jgi:ParB/RepB/Spo0J family partition protein
MNEPTKRYYAHIPVDQIHGFPNNHRRNFDAEKLRQLGESLATQGMIEPVIVMRATTVNGLVAGYEGIAGERRWRAAKLAGMQEVPAIVYDGLARAQALELALVENLQRVDVNPIEEAAGLRALMEGASMTQQQVADRIGKPRSSVANALRLLELPEFVQEWIRDGEMTRAHGIALLRWRRRPELLEMLARLAHEHSATASELEGGVPLLEYWPEGYCQRIGKGSLSYQPEKSQLLQQMMAEGPYVESWLEAEYCYVCLDTAAYEHFNAEWNKVVEFQRERAEQQRAEISARAMAKEAAGDWDEEDSDCSAPNDEVEPAPGEEPAVDDTESCVPAVAALPGRAADLELAGQFDEWIRQKLSTHIEMIDHDALGYMDYLGLHWRIRKEGPARVQAFDARYGESLYGCIYDGDAIRTWPDICDRVGGNMLFCLCTYLAVEIETLFDDCDTRYRSELSDEERLTLRQIMRGHLEVQQ